MQKRVLSIFVICNVLVLLLFLAGWFRGSYTVTEPYFSLEEENSAQAQVYELTGNGNVVFEFNNSLTRVNNFILKFSNCRNHEVGTLSVRIHDASKEYYVYEVPTYAFEDDLFFLYTNEITGLKKGGNYYLTVRVADLEQGSIVLHGAEESPFWGIEGEISHVTDACYRFLIIWILTNVFLAALWLLAVKVIKKERLQKLAGMIMQLLRMGLQLLQIVWQRVKALPKYTYAYPVLLAFVGIAVLIATHMYADEMLEENTYEYWSQNNVAEFENIPVKDGEIRQVFRAGYDRMTEFILAFDNYSPGDTAILCANLEDSKGNVYYSWKGSTASLAGETFYLMASMEEKLQQGKKYYFRVFLEDGESDVTVRATSTKKIHQSVGKLTVDKEKQDGVVLYFFQKYTDVFSYAGLWWIIILLTLGVMIVWAFLTDKLNPRVGRMVSAFLIAIVVYYNIESLSGNFDAISLRYALTNILLFFGICLVLRVVLLKVASYVVILLGLVAGLANYYVLEFRGSELLFTDVKSFSTAMSVAGNYEFAIPPLVFTTALVSVCMILLQSMVDIETRRVRYKVKLKDRAALLGIGAGVLVLLAISLNFVYINFFTLGKNFAQYGWSYTNLLVVKNSSMQKPFLYSDKQIETIIAEIEEEEVEVPVTPKNLIVIMNESLSDLQIVGELETNRDYMPFIRSLSENSVKGSLHVSTFGGNTCITEYEFLTGNSRHFMPMGSIPYSNSRIFDREEAGMVRVLQEQGYYAVAMHPYGPSNWNRDKVYPAMGFDEFISLEDYEGAELLRNYVSDKADYQKIIEYYENFDRDENLFIFNVTMQNHGGFDVNNGTLDTTITIENFESAIGETYLSLVYESDKAFEYLLSYFSEVEEPTMIVMFGDHQPSLPDSFYELLYGKSMDDLSEYEESFQYITPYVIWTNYDSDFEEIPAMSVNYLGRVVLQYAGLEMSEFDKFLLDKREEVPVVGLCGIYDKDGQFMLYKHVPNELLDDYEMLQYLRMEDRESELYDIFSIE